ncbi:unnamed protein product, partial [Prorocentrum cordatum]
MPRVRRFRGLRSPFRGATRTVNTGDLPAAMRGGGVVGIAGHRDWVTCRGFAVDPGTLGKRTLKYLIEQDTQRGLTGKVDGLSAGPLLQPMVKQLQSLRAPGRGVEAALVAGVAPGGYATQRCLFEDSRALSPLRRWCGAFTGAPKRGFVGCDGSKLARESLDIGDVLGLG